MNFNKWHGFCILVWIVIFLLFGCWGKAQAREKGPGFYVEYGQSLAPVETFYFDSNPTQNTSYKDMTYISYTDVNIHHIFGLWNLQIAPFANIKTWAIPRSNFIGGNPFCDIYTVGIEIVWNNISISVNHYCAHPVFNSEKNWMVKDYRIGQNADEIKIRYSFN